MTTWQVLLTTWHAHPRCWIGCAALAAGYFVAIRFRPAAAALYYLAGVLLLLLALISPLHVLGERYLFSAHMLQHLLLLQAAPPLLLLGIPAQPPLGGVVAAPVARRWSAGIKQVGTAAGATEAVPSRPALAWALASARCGHNVPAFYNATLAHAGVHIAEHLCFLATATIFWYPILGRQRLAVRSARRCICSPAGCQQPRAYPDVRAARSARRICTRSMIWASCRWCVGWGYPGGRPAARRPADVGARQPGLSWRPDRDAARWYRAPESAPPPGWRRAAHGAPIKEVTWHVNGRRPARQPGAGRRPFHSARSCVAAPRLAPAGAHCAAPAHYRRRRWFGITARRIATSWLISAVGLIVFVLALAGGSEMFHDH
jgi:hypothetical protein